MIAPGGEDFEDEDERKTRRAPEVDLERDGRADRKLQRNDIAIQSTEAVCNLYLQGYSIGDIAKRSKLSLAIVREMIDASRQIWLERHDRSLSDLVSEQLAKIDRVESRAWESYELSRKMHVEKQESSGSNDKGSFSSLKTTKRKQSGMSDFLNVVLHCVKQRCQLLGLDKRAEDDAMRHNSMLVVVSSPEEARAIQDYQQFQKMVDGTVVSKEEEKAE